MITNLIQAIKTYWGYLMTIVAIGTTIFTFGVKSATKDINSKSSDARIEKWIMYDSISHNQNTEFQNYVVLHLRGISDTNRILYDTQHRLTNTVATMGLKITNTVPELFHLMNGLQFELVQPEPVRSVFPETKIHIMKKDSIK